MFDLLTNDREFADHNKQLLRRVAVAVDRAAAIAAARKLQPLWSQPDSKPPRFEDGLDRGQEPVRAILSDINLNAPKELTQ